MPKLQTVDINYKKTEKKELTFYDIFRIGWEFEMEAKRGITLSAGFQGDIIEVVSDGSINTKNSGKPLEVRTSKPVVNEEEEKTFMEEMKMNIPEFKSASGENVFAHYNTTCGTHYHFSFKKLPDNYLWLFNTIDFEKFFMRKYLETFTSEKFLARINNSYCKSPNITGARGTETKPGDVRKDLNKIRLESFRNQNSRNDGDRYQWLNMQSVTEHTGAEIRIFPFLQTYSGIELVTKFMKEMLMEFYLKPETQQKIKLLELYEDKIARNGINTKKLNELKRIVFHYLCSNDSVRLDHGMLRENLPGEFRLLLAKWATKQPALIKKTKAI